MMTDWIQVRQRIFDAFANVEKPDFSSIPTLGCCERHEHDFDWYRRHEFKKVYLPLYSSEQRQAIAEALEWYRQWYLAQHGYDYDEPDDEEAGGKISETIALVWLKL